MNDGKEKWQKYGLALVVGGAGMMLFGKFGILAAIIVFLL